MQFMIYGVFERLRIKDPDPNKDTFVRLLPDTELEFPLAVFRSMARPRLSRTKAPCLFHVTCVLNPVCPNIIAMEN